MKLNTFISLHLRTQILFGLPLQLRKLQLILEKFIKKMTGNHPRKNYTETICLVMLVKIESIYLLLHLQATQDAWANQSINDNKHMDKSNLGN